MTERERIAGLAQQIELARKYLDQWPDWLRSSAHFSGANHASDVASGSDRRAVPDQNLIKP